MQKKFTIRQAVAVFTGIDTYCRTVQVAYDNEGTAWQRFWRYDGYGLNPSRWAKDTLSPSLEKAIADGKVDWGFKTLSGGAVAA